MTRARVHPIVIVALFVYVVSLPLEIPDRGGFPLEVHTATGALLLLAALLYPAGAWGRPPSAFWWFAGYFYIFVCMGVMTEYVGQWLKDAATFLQVLLLFWVTSALLRDVQVATRVMLAYAATCVVLSALQRLGVTASVAEVGSVAVRMTALGQNPNTFAHNLSLALLMLVGLAYGADRLRPSHRPLVWLPAALLGLTIMPTAARGALLSLAVGLFIILLPRGSSGRQLRNVVLVGLAFVGLAAAVWRSDAMRDRLVASAETSDMAKREDLFPAAWTMFLEKPLAGWGPVNNRFELVRYVPRAELPFRETHNLVLELLTETGLIGATPFLVGIGLCVRAAWRARAGAFGALPLAMVASLLVTKMGTAGVATKMHWLVLACAVSWTPVRVVIEWPARQSRARTAPRHAVSSTAS